MIDQFFYWSGVVVWCASILLLLVAMLRYLSVNIPGVLRGDGWTVYKFGIGEVAVITSDDMAQRMRRCGFHVHDGDGYWWSAKVFRILI